MTPVRRASTGARTPRNGAPAAVPGGAARTPGNGAPAAVPAGAAPDGTHSRIASLQRARLLAAAVDACAEHGAANLTVGHIVERSGVSRRTFYENFQGREDCILAAVEQALGRLAQDVAPAHRAPGRWLERTRAAVLGTLAFFDEEPQVARLLIVETLASGPRVLRQRQAILTRLTAALEEARGEARRTGEPPPLASESALGGALAVLHARLLDADHGPLTDLSGQLMSVLVLPHLGAGAARRELTRPLPRSTPRRSPAGNPLSGLGMRLTYRTVRLLSAVANHPHASNRELAAAAGIQDQGQASKLLTRLRRLGLIQNAAHAEGAANAWTLTETGVGIQRAISTLDGGDADPAAASAGASREGNLTAAYANL